MPSPRGVRAAFFAVGLATVVLVSMFVWPGFYSTAICESTESINNRTYCAETVLVSLGLGNHTLRGYTLALDWVITPDGPICQIVVSEPNGTTYSGGVGFIGPTPRASSSWFTPDNRAGAITYSYGYDEVGNLTLLVAV